MNEEKIDEIKEKVSLGGLYINRVPKKTRTEFIEWAKEEFCDDRGMALKWLMDFRNGLLSNPNQILMEQMSMMAQEIESLKSVPQEQQKKKVIRSVGGTVITEKEE
jgi:hypothetical protein